MMPPLLLPPVELVPRCAGAGGAGFGAGGAAFGFADGTAGVAALPVEAADAAAADVVAVAAGVVAAGDGGGAVAEALGAREAPSPVAAAAGEAAGSACEAAVGSVGVAAAGGVSTADEAAGLGSAPPSSWRNMRTTKSNRATPARAMTTRTAVLLDVDTGISIGSWSSVRTPDAATGSPLSLAGRPARERVRAGRADGGSFSGGGEGARSTRVCGSAARAPTTASGSAVDAPAKAAGSPVPAFVFPAGAACWPCTAATPASAIGALASAAAPVVWTSVGG